MRLFPEIPQRLGASDVGADQVALDRVVVGGPAVEPDADASAAADQVAGPGGGSADGVVGSTDEADVVAEVAESGGSGGVGAEVVAFDRVLIRAVEQDAAAVVGVGRAVGGDHVAGQGGRSADHVARRTPDGIDSATTVARGLGPRGVDTDIVARDRVVLAVELDSVAAEAIDRQAKNDVVATGEFEAIDVRAGGRAVEGDQGRAGVAWLRGSIDGDVGGDGRKSRLQADGLRAAADAEVDRRGTRCLVGAYDRLTEGTYSGVGRVAYRECREKLTRLQRDHFQGTIAIPC